MRVILQRVREAGVKIDGRTVGAIGTGLVGLVGIAPDDDDTDVSRLAERMLGYRLFPDPDGRMNLSVRDIDGGILLVPNFTVMADTRKGMRPGFSTAAEPVHAATLFERLVQRCSTQWPHTACGEFGADMQVSLVNDGPITVILDTRPN